MLGDPLWFSMTPTGPTQYHPSLGSNPYGQAAFYDKDSGGFLFDFPYAPTQIVSVLGACKSVMAHSRISVADHHIVPEEKYDEFVAQATDPDDVNYWDVVLDLPRTHAVRMEGPDNVFSLYEMKDGIIGVLHVGRIFHPVLPGTGAGSFQVFGTDGNIIIRRRLYRVHHLQQKGAAAGDRLMTAGITSPCVATRAKPSGRSPRPARSTITTNRRAT